MAARRPLSIVPPAPPSPLGARPRPSPGPPAPNPYAEWYRLKEKRRAACSAPAALTEPVAEQGPYGREF